MSGTQIASFSKLRRGASTAVLGVLALLLSAGCRDASAPTGTEGPAQPTSATPSTPTTPNTPPRTPPSGGTLSISGNMGSDHQGIRVSIGGAPVLSAIVTVNGFVMRYCCGDLYAGTLPEAVAAGDTLHLKVEAGAVKFEASGEVIAAPTITAPAEGVPIPSRDTITLAWSSPADPDLFEVCVNCWENSIYGDAYPTSGSERHFKFPAFTVADFGAGAPVAVFAYTNGFMKSVSAEVTADVHFIARSRDLIITLKP